MEYYSSDPYGSYQQEPKKKNRNGAGLAIVLSLTAIAVVIGLFAGVLIMNRTLNAQKQAELPEETNQQTVQQTVEPSSTEAEPVSTAVAIAPRTDAGTTSTGFAYDGLYTRAQVVEMSAPSVVGIDGVFETTVSYWGRTQTYEQTGSGSGVILTSDGYIATCAHVVDGAKSLTVTLNDDTTYEAKIIGSDARNDIAIIKIEAKDLIPATLGDSSMLTVGEDVIAIGNPLGELRGTATSGIISAVKRTITVEDTQMELIQTDAAISPGNSGGGLFNSSGQLIGIVNAKVSDTDAEGLGFAIPINSVYREINDLLNYGYVTGRAYLGVYTQNVTMRSDYGYYMFGSGTSCVQIADVEQGSAADAAGLKAGDLILKIDERTISSNADLSDAIGKYNAGDTATLTIQRSGSQQQVQVTFGEYKPQ